MANPIISIIIPTYNRAHFIGETLDSILIQTYNEWECIVIDDHSTDYTEELMEFYIAKDERISFYKRPEELKKGPNSCRNFGFSLSNGSLINWFDSDDILLPNAIEKRIWEVDELYDLSVCNLRFIDEFGQPVELTHNFQPSTNIVEEYFLGNITFYTFTPLWSRRFLEQQEELFDEQLSNLDDWDFNLRMMYKNPKIIYLPEILILYRIHKNSLSREIDKLNFKEIQSEFRARGKHLKLLKNSDLNLKRLRFHDKEKCRIKLRAALAINHPKKFSLFIMLLKRQFGLMDFQGLAKTTLGFLTIILFNKGDKLFR